MSPVDAAGSSGGTAGRRWRELQQARAIPPEIEAAAPRSPYRHDPAHFRAPARPPDTPSSRAARALLHARSDGVGSGAVVLDVGCGGGAASLAVADAADALVGLDHHPGMLDAFAADCAARGIRHRTVLGEWPSVAAEAGPAEVVVCHHVGYNTVDLPPFLSALSEAAGRGVVMELTATHPMAWLDPLWARFHGVHRGAAATVDDVVAVLAELGVIPEVTRWERPTLGPEDPLWVARRLCLPDSRADDVAAALADLPPRPRTTVTLTW